MMDKTFDPAAVEARIAARWDEADAFRAGRPDRANAEPYSIVIPPPNVTGSLHMGHALNNTLQDILCRFERMRGKDVLWQPGTDHAGIATQMVVERKLAAENRTDRRAMGRAAFLDEVWKQKQESEGIILGQLKRLGASCDWSRTRFTLDEGLSRAVLKVFVDLLPAGADLQGQAPRQLGPQVPDRHLRPGGAAGRGEGPSLAHPLSDRGRARPLHHRSRNHAARNHAGRHRRGGPPRGRALPRSRRQIRNPAAGRAGASRSSPTSIPTRKRAPAQSRSRRRTTSTISRSGGGTIFRRSISLNPKRRLRLAERRLRRWALRRRRIRTHSRATASTASKRASASSRCWRSEGCSRKSSRTPTRFRMATAPAW